MNLCLPSITDFFKKSFRIQEKSALYPKLRCSGECYIEVPVYFQILGPNQLSNIDNEILTVVKKNKGLYFDI